jgi:hypothetical protein
VDDTNLIRDSQLHQGASCSDLLTSEGGTSAARATDAILLTDQGHTECEAAPPSRSTTDFIFKIWSKH